MGGLCGCACDGLPLFPSPSDKRRQDCKVSFYKSDVVFTLRVWVSQQRLVCWGLHRSAGAIMGVCNDI
jgi:hypothetical protein